MVKTKFILTRSTAIVSAIALLGATIAPALVITTAAKAGLPASRKITMSTSAAGATKVVYSLSFTTDQGGAASNIGGMVIDFCDNSPIIGDSCTDLNTAHAFNTNAGGGSGGTLVLANQSGITGWSKDNTSTSSRLVLTRGVTSIGSSTAVTLDLGDGSQVPGQENHSMVNPDIGNHTFYARILTFSTAAAAQGYNPTTNPTASYVDYGGAALSTANQLVITSKVQERLTFCVYTGGACATDTAMPGQSAITLGNDKGVLETGGEYVDNNAKFDISTNAVSGATVVMKGDVPKTGAFEISSSLNSGMGASATTAYASNPGNEQFGMCLWQLAGAGLTFPTAAYNNANCNSVTSTAGGPTSGGAGTAQFGFNRTNVASSSGDVVAFKPAGTPSTASLAFIGNIASTTEAGIYQTTLTYVATGQY